MAKFNCLSFLQSILLCIYYWLESISNFFIQLVCPKKKSFKNDVVLVTGAASGIGRLLCVALASHSLCIIAWDINEEGLEETKRVVYEKNGQVIHCYYCDLGSRDSIQRVSKSVFKRHGPVSLVISNAGVLGCTTSVIEQSSDNFERTFNINTLAHFWMARAFLPTMIANKKGHLAFMTSSAGNYGAPRLSPYCSSKAAASIFCETLDLELKLLGVSQFIQTTCIAPFLINTSLFSGCTTRYPVLTPCLDAHFVVKRILSAIQSNQKLVCIGRYVYFLNLLKREDEKKVRSLWLQYDALNDCFLCFNHRDVIPIEWQSK